MKVIEKELAAECEWCKTSHAVCDVLLYGEDNAIVICRDCLTSLKTFLEEIGVKEAEV